MSRSSTSALAAGIAWGVLAPPIVAALLFVEALAPRSVETGDAPQAWDPDRDRWSTVHEEDPAPEPATPPAPIVAGAEEEDASDSLQLLGLADGRGLASRPEQAPPLRVSVFDGSAWGPEEALDAASIDSAVSLPNGEILVIATRVTGEGEPWRWTPGHGWARAPEVPALELFPISGDRAAVFQGWPHARGWVLEGGRWRTVAAIPGAHDGGAFSLRADGRVEIVGGAVDRPPWRRALAITVVLGVLSAPITIARRRDAASNGRRVVAASAIAFVLSVLAVLAFLASALAHVPMGGG